LPLGQTTSYAHNKLNRIQLQLICTSSSQWYQIVAAGHPRRATTWWSEEKPSGSCCFYIRQPPSNAMNCIVWSFDVYAHQVPSGSRLWPLDIRLRAHSMMLRSKMERHLLPLGLTASNAHNKLNRILLQLICTSSSQWFQTVAAGHPRRADNTMPRRITERLVFLLGQATSTALTKLHMMEFQLICTSSSQWFQIAAVDESHGSLQYSSATSNESIICAYFSGDPKTLLYVSKLCWYHTHSPSNSTSPGADFPLRCLGDQHMIRLWRMHRWNGRHRKYGGSTWKFWSIFNRFGDKGWVKFYPRVVHYVSLKQVVRRRLI